MDIQIHHGISLWWLMISIRGFYTGALLDYQDAGIYIGLLYGALSSYVLLMRWHMLLRGVGDEKSIDVRMIKMRICTAQNRKT